jgi:hypothetical protein
VMRKNEGEMAATAAATAAAAWSVRPPAHTRRRMTRQP